MISPEFGLDDHFSTIVRMLITGEVDNYEMIMESEVNRFEKFLKDRKINYVKSTNFGNMMTPSYYFEIPDKPRHKVINPPPKLLDEAVKRFGEGMKVMKWSYTGETPQADWASMNMLCPEVHKNLWAMSREFVEKPHLRQEKVPYVHLERFVASDTIFFYAACKHCGQVHWCYVPKES
ncbi:hypothetical protein [Bacillus phage Nachito]|nr:hypothetical protein [Bacillus phage Nachito]